MSAPTARRLLTAGSLALALALAAPAAAFAGADEGPDRDRNEGSKPAPTASSTASPAPASSSGESSKSQSSSASQGSSKSDSKKRKSAPMDRAAKADPRGNNGTVKIDGEAFDDGRGNEPHVGCVFQVDFYGFDAGDTATITFTGKAPTGGGLLHSETRTLISDDAAGGGQDRDATLTYSVSNQLSELLSVTPHPKQGWHVKLAVDVDSAPGGAKQKVFWIDCPQTTGSGAGTTRTSPTNVVTGTTSAPATGGGGAATAVPRRFPLRATLGAGDVTLSAGTTQAAASGGKGAGAATVSGQAAAQPSALPFTGAEGLGYLLALGLSAVGVGTAAHRLGRRRATGSSIA